MIRTNVDNFYNGANVGQGSTDNVPHETFPSSDLYQLNSYQNAYFNAARNRKQEKESIYNILLIGPSQSGKSTLVEAIGQFFSPGSKIDFSHIGDGNLSCTKEVRVVEYVSHIPEFELINTNRPISVFDDAYHQEKPNEIKINVPIFLGERSHKSYKKKINQENDLEVRQAPPRSQKRHIFRIYDTPGLEDTGGEDVKNVANILEAVAKTDKFHLVLVTISLGTHLSPGLQTALEDFRNMFSDLGGLFAFVHTKADFLNMHPENKKYTEFLAARTEKLDEIMGREVRCFVIDLCLEEDRPVCIYLRQRLIRDIVSLTRQNLPVPVNQIQLAKTEQMCNVDARVIQILTEDLKEIERRTLNLQDKVNASQTKNDADTMKDIARFNLDISKIQHEIARKKEEVDRLDTDNYIFLGEKMIQQVYYVFFSRPSTELRADGLPCTIDEIREENSGFEIESVEGGQGYDYWIAKIRRQAWSNGSYHVKFYAKSRTRYQLKISQFKKSLIDLADKVESNERVVVSLKTNSPKEDDPETKEQRKQIHADHSKLLKAIARAERRELHLNLFKAIAAAGVYETKPKNECLKGSVPKKIDPNQSDLEKSAIRVADFYREYVPVEKEM